MTQQHGMLAQLEAYLTRWASFPTADYPFVLSLWTVATYLWSRFSAFPYLVITSATKRSGKTLVSELAGFAASRARNITGATPPSVFRMIRDEQATLIMDEAERMSSENASLMRELLNSGYRRGQTIPRVGKGGENEYWPSYCPKVFVLIGDVSDTLRDRSVIIIMRRSEAPQRYQYDKAQAEGESLREKLGLLVKDIEQLVTETYATHAGLAFLPPRDEEIWLPLFAVCAVLAPERVEELQRIAVDMATEKTSAPMRYTAQAQKDAEESATASEYGVRLLRDLIALAQRDGVVWTLDVIEQLKAMPLAPWRKYRGDGLNEMTLASLLRPFRIRPRQIRRRKQGKLARGYTVEQLQDAAQKHGI